MLWLNVLTLAASLCDDAPLACTEHLLPEHIWPQNQIAFDWKWTQKPRASGRQKTFQILRRPKWSLLPCRNQTFWILSRQILVDEFFCCQDWMCLAKEIHMHHHPQATEPMLLEPQLKESDINWIYWAQMQKMLQLMQLLLIFEALPYAWESQWCFPFPLSSDW